MNIQTFGARASVIRAAKRELGKLNIEFDVEQIEATKNEDGRWTWANFEAMINPPKKETKRLEGILRKSAMEGACRLVWDIAEDMLHDNPDTKRKDIIQACVDEGIAFYTARTQYQKYREALKEAYAEADE